MEASATGPELTEGSVSSSGQVAADPEGERARSAEEPNPFCSERATEEFRLRQARPLGLAEFDDRQLEPEYGSEAGRSVGFASAAAVSLRASSPVPVRGSEVSSEARVSQAASNAASVTSRSRSPAREELLGVRELLVSLGNAVAGLAEEQRATQQRLSIVEEIRSGSTSSMRTGREAVELDSGQVGIGDHGLGAQFFQIGDGEPMEDRSLRSGMLPLEDWVQDSVGLEDIPDGPPAFEPFGVRNTRGRGSVGVWYGEDVGQEVAPGSGDYSVRAGARWLHPGLGVSSFQAGAPMMSPMPCIPSAQVGARSALQGQETGSAQAGARSALQGQETGSAQASARSAAQGQETGSAQAGARSALQGRETGSAQASALQGQETGSAQAGARSAAQGQETGSAHAGARSALQGRETGSAQAGARSAWSIRNDLSLSGPGRCSTDVR